MTRYPLFGQRSSVSSTPSRSGRALRRRSRHAAVGAASAPLRERFSTLELLENRTLLSMTYTVTTLADTSTDPNQMTLRQAIAAANASAGADTIVFQAGLTGTISLGSALPAITDAVTITGNTVGGVPQIVLDGSGAGFGASGLDVEAGGGGSTISGLSIVNFGGGAGILVNAGGTLITNDYLGVMPDLTGAGNNDGIDLFSAGNTVQNSVVSTNFNVGIEVGGNNNVITGNDVGSDATGTMNLGNFGNGVEVNNGSGNSIRGNVISGNMGNGVRIANGDGNVVAGNMIGVDVTGMVAMPNQGNGVIIDSGATDTMVGGTSAAARNVISGNWGSGVDVSSAAGAGNKVLGNYVGTDVTGGNAVGNLGDGVTVYGTGVLIQGNVLSGNVANGASLFGDGNTVIGNDIGTAADGVSPLSSPSGGFSDGLWVQGNNNVIGAPGRGNVIAYNGYDGVEVFLGAGNAIRYNSIHDNAVMGIDLGDDGHTLNDASGHDGSNNNYQDYPLITGMTYVNGVLTISGTAFGDPDTTYTVDLYATDSQDSQMYGQGRDYLMSVTVTTDSSGQANFSVSTSNVPATDAYVVGTATDGMGNTSEFSMAAAIPPNTIVHQNADTTTTLSGGGSATIGQTVSFTASVVANSGTLAPQGSVTFFDNGVAVDTEVLAGDGTATFTTSSLALGDHSITAVFTAADGSGFNGSASAPVDEMVGQDFTTTLLASNTTVTTTGQPITFTAVVTPGHNFSGTPTGTVTFFDNGVAIGTIALSGNQAVLTTTSLTVGTHTITATYNGDTDFQASTSNSLTETVNAPVVYGTISGHVYRDTTGNGLSNDDTALSGVKVELFKDTNNNGVYDSADKMVTSVVSANDGSYSFGNLAAGKYFVVEVTPSGYVRTAPAATTYYTESVNGGTYTADFDNYKTCTCSSNVTNISYTINGCTTVSDLRGHTHQGDTVTVHFTVLAHQSVTLSFVTYTCPDNYFNANDASQQMIYNYETGTFTAGSRNTTFTMTVKIPKCDYQIDFVCGQMIDHFGPAGSNVFYTQEGRLFSADNGGTSSSAGVKSIGGSVLND